MRKTELDARITFDGDLCHIAIKGRSPIRARVLGERTEDGERLIYLDRIVHEPWVTHLGTWRVSGAVSSILSPAKFSHAPD